MNPWLRRMELSRRPQVYIDDYTNPLQLREKPKKLHRHVRRRMNRANAK